MSRNTLSPPTFSPEQERFHLEFVLFKFEPVVRFIVTCFFIMSGQEKRQLDLIERHIKNKVSKHLLEEYQNYLSQSVGETIVFSGSFKWAFQSNLIRIIHNKNFRNEDMVSVYCYISDRVYSKLGMFSALYFLNDKKNSLYSFAKDIGFFETNNNKTNRAEKIFNKQWELIDEHTLKNKKANADGELSVIVILATVSSLIWYGTGLNKLTNMLIGIFLYAIILVFTVRKIYRTIFPDRALKNLKIDGKPVLKIIEDRELQVLKLKKINWSVRSREDNKYYETYHRPVIEKPKSDDPSEQKTFFDNLTKTASAINKNKEKKKNKNANVKDGKLEEEEIEESESPLISIKIEGLYHFDVSDPENSTMFPIEGNLSDKFFVAIHDDYIMEDIMGSGLKGGNVTDLFNSIKNRIKFVIFGNSCQNLKPLGVATSISLGKVMCYELRLLGNHSNERLIGFPQRISTEDRRSICLVRLNAYTNNAHKQQKLNTCIGRSLNRLEETIEPKATNSNESVSNYTIK